MQTSTEAFVAMDDGVRLWTATSRSDAMPVVLCHGGAGLWDYLESVATMLAPVACVHRWDQRGCGRSERAGPYSLTRCLADLELLRRHFGHERWLVGGHSWGASLALRYALEHPARTLGVLYVSGTGFGQAWRAAYHEEADRRLTPAQRHRRDGLGQRSRTAGDEREWRTLCYASDVGDPRRAFAIAERFADVPFAINVECNRALNDEEKQTLEADVLDRCGRLEVPVRVVHGARDPRPVWAVESLVAALPQAGLTVLDGVGHLPWLEDPAAFEGVARDFVLDVASRAPLPRGRDDLAGGEQRR